jgi:hypothetical protein
MGDVNPESGTDMPTDDPRPVCAQCGADLRPVNEAQIVEHDCATGDVLPTDGPRSGTGRHRRRRRWRW